MCKRGKKAMYLFFEIFKYVVNSFSSQKLEGCATGWHLFYCVFTSQMTKNYSSCIWISPFYSDICCFDVDLANIEVERTHSTKKKLREIFDQGLTTTVKFCLYQQHQHWTQAKLLLLIRLIASASGPNERNRRSWIISFSSDFSLLWYSCLTIATANTQHIQREFDSYYWIITSLEHARHKL